MYHKIFSKKYLLIALGVFLFQLYDASGALAYPIQQPFTVKEVRMDEGKIRVIGSYINDAGRVRRIDSVSMDITFHSADSRDVRIVESYESKVLQKLTLTSGSGMTLNLSLAALNAYGEADREVIVRAIRDKAWSAPPEKNYVETLMA